MTHDVGLRETLVPLPAAEEWVDLRDCLSPASFWLPEQLGPQHSWVEHAPFAFWLAEALRPRIIVELGTCQRAAESPHFGARKIPQIGGAGD